MYVFLLYIALAFLYAPPALLRRAFLLKKFKHLPTSVLPSSEKENKSYSGVHPLQTLGAVGAWIFLISLPLLVLSLSLPLVPLAIIGGLGLAISPFMIIVGNFPYVWLSSYVTMEVAAIKNDVVKVKRQRSLMGTVWVTGILVGVVIPIIIVYARAH